MRVVIQRVTKASVEVDNLIVSSIESGLVVLLGIENEDNSNDIEWLTTKISQLRIFDDQNKVMNNSLIDVNGDIIVISQFTLHASTRKGNRPSYLKASKSDFANKIYKEFLSSIEIKIKKKPFSGFFGADMLVKIENDGPVTIFIDSKNKE
ncbi:MAG: D-aminoacyl-tRNA deacylase [Bacteroidetes bacterium]|jgi:D-aminoacyl-tRNA deacylase|nr:MAG: D-tyrosyl-tRNA(Tyr) deacylase [Cryomorphaceae bacterium BACL29 MAG-121220-bin8]MDA0758299.1 D-aminoacyl-tRNA deacylase [Bacteroidota bacterium]MDA1018728.1 D-aminoacyl-tRNA deacylase [Bacteroidota bacterium]|tara:strand:- start:62364 stop:62816 length:453 start_codon:yes stop_codon:yes gene_type:complete